MSSPPRAPEGAARPAVPRWRRWLRRLAWLCGAIAALTVLVHTAPAREFLRRLLEQGAGRALGGTVAIEQLDYRLWAGTATAERVRATRPGLELFVEHLDLGFGPPAGLRARVLAPRVVVTAVEDGRQQSPPPAAGPGQPWSVLTRFSELSIENGALELRDASSQPWLRLEALEARLERGAERSAGHVRVPRAALGWPGGGLRLEPVSAETEVAIDGSDGSLQLTRTRLVTGETVLEADGRLERLAPITTQVEARGAIDARLFRDLQPDVEMEGPIDARLTFAHGANGGTGSLRLETPALSVTGIGPWKGAAQARFEGRRLVLEAADFEGYDGRLSASGPVLLWDGTTELDVRVSRVDVAAFAQTFAEFRPPLSSRVDGSLTLTLRDWELPSLRGQGRLAFRPAEFAGWPVSGPASIALVGRRLEFSTEALQAREAHLAAHGSLGFDKQLGLEYRAALPRAEGLRALLADAGVALPDLAVSGALRAEGAVQGRLPDWRASARVSSEGLRIEDVDFEMQGGLTLSPTVLEIGSLTARGPEVDAEISGLVPIDSPGRWDVRGNLAGVRLTDALARHGLPLPTSASGSFEVTGPAATPEARFSLEAIAEAVATETSGDVGDPAGQPAAATATPVAPVLPGATAEEMPATTHTTAPAEAAPDAGAAEPAPARDRAVLRLSGVASTHSVVLETAEAELGGGRASASGRWDVGSGTLEGRLEASAVELQRLPWLPAALAGLESTLTASLEIAGKATAPAGRARLGVASLAWRRQALPDIELEASSDGADLGMRGRVADRPLLDGRMALVEPWPLHLDVDLAALPLTALLHTLPAAAQDALRVDGRLTLDVPLADLPAARYAADVTALELSLDRTWRAGPFRVRGGLQELSVEELTLQAGESRISAHGRLGAPDAEGLAVDATLPLHEIGRLLPDLELAGQSQAALKLSGPLSEPDLSGRIELRDVHGRLGRIAFEKGEIVGTASGGVLTLEQATARVAGGAVTASGGFPFGPRAPRTPQQLAIEVSGLDLGSLVPTTAAAPRLATTIDVSARVVASEPALAAISASGDLTRALLGVGSQRLELEQPVAWRFAAGRLDPVVARLSGPTGRLAFEASFDALGSEPRFDGRLSGDADLSLLNPFFAELGTLGGPARLDLSAGFGADGLELRGEAHTQGSRLTLKTPPLTVTNLTGTLRANGTRLDVADWTGEVGDGRLTAGGQIGLGQSDPEVDLSLRAERVPLSYPEGMRSRFTGQVRLAGREGRYRLAGDVQVLRALYQRQTDRSSQAIDSLATELAAFDQRGSPLERVQLDVRVTLEDGLRIENDQASLAVDGGFTLGGDMLTPEVSGAVALRQGGSVRLGRARLRLQEGRVELAGYPARPPRIDASGVTQVGGVQIEADLTGPLDDFRMNLSSPNRSDLTQGDLATLILTGRTAAAAASDSGAILAEELAVALGEALDRQLGGAVFVDVSPDDSLLSLDDTDPTQRFNIGIPVGQRLYVIYSNALDRSAQRLILDVRPGFGVRVRLIKEEDDSNTFEVSQRFDLNLWSHRQQARTRKSSARLRALRIEGLPAAEASRLAARPGLAAGDEVDFFEAEAAATRLRATLVEDGYLTALVEHDEIAAGENELDVVLQVEPGPRLRIEWAGEAPDKHLRKRALQGWEAGTPIEDAALLIARALRRELQAQGHFRASVVPLVERRPEQATVVFDVRRGAKGPGVEVRYSGIEAVRAATLDAALPGHRTPEFFALLEPEGQARLSAALRLPYARLGFLEARVGTPRQELDAAGGLLRVTIPIEEGARARIVALELPEEARGSDAPPGNLELALGEPFRIDAYVGDRARLGAWYRRQGYPEARVVGILDPVEGGLLVRFVADPGPRPTLREVRVASDGKVRRDVVDTALTLGPGDRVVPRALSESREHLTDTRVFRGIDLRTEPTDDPALRDLVVDLVERPDIGVEYALRYTTSGSGEVGGSPSNPEGGRLQAAAAVELPNPFGWAHRYRLYGLLGSERTTYGLSFDAPTFFGRRWRTQLFLYNDEDRKVDLPGYAQRIRGAAFQLTRRWRTEISEDRWRDSLRMQWGYAFKRVRYTELATLQSVESNRAGPNNSLIGDTRDSLTDPHHGLFWSLGADLNLRLLGSAEDYLKLYGQLFAYVPLGGRVVWASGLRLGLVPGSNPLLLIEGRFKAGGSTTVRGFAENSLGPRTVDGVALGGQASFVFNQELRFPIWNRLHGGVFYDAGNVWGLARNLDVGDLRHSVGAGLRAMFPFGPVRLDWARVLEPREGEKHDRFLFTLGHAF